MSRWKAVCGLGVVALILSGCAASPGQSSGDYPHYDRENLVSEATLIVEGEPVAAESTVLTPRHDGETSEENPVLGLSEEEKQKVLSEDGGIAAIAVTFRIDRAHRGDALPGDEVVIIQTDTAEEVPLQESEKYLLFTREGLDGTFVILGASAGAYISTDGESFTAVNPEEAPFATVTSGEVAALME